MPIAFSTSGLYVAASEQLLRKVERSIEGCATLAFERLSSDLSPRYRICSIAIRHPPLPHLPPTVAEVHASYFAQCRADGMLYHVAICEAARRRRWEVHLHHRGEELAKAAGALGATPDEVEQFVNGLRQTLKPPWTAEYRHAFAAAIATLKTHSTGQMKLPPSPPGRRGPRR